MRSSIAKSHESSGCLSSPKSNEKIRVMCATREAAAAVVFEYDDDGKLTWCFFLISNLAF